ncbi:MAG TPA: glycosyltransferase family 2 protein [Polyangiaceae bacterium]|jgi:hypothetical protein
MNGLASVLRASWGRPRHALGIGNLDWTHLDGITVAGDDALAKTRETFDAAVVELPSSDEAAQDRLRAAMRVLSDGGHVLLPITHAVSFTEGQRLRRGFERASERTVRLAEAAGLEVLRVDVRRHAAVVVARVAPKRRKLSLTVGMLTLNEQQSVERMIDEIRQYAPDAGILLVDSSTDETPDLARAKGADVIRQLPARGHGPAMEQLMYAAAERSDALVYIDCDFTYPTEYIPRILELLEDGADVVNGTRTHKYPKAMPVPNFIANRVFAATAQILHGIPTTDLHSGLRGYRSSVIRAFSFSGEQDALPVTTLIVPARSGYRVVDLPIPYAEREGTSKLAKFRGTAWTFARVATSFGKGRRVRRGRNYSHVGR